MIVTAFVLWEWPISWRIQPGKVPRKWQEMNANKPFLGSSWNGQYFRNGTTLFSKLYFWSLWSLHHNEYHYPLGVVQPHYSFVLTIFYVQEDIVDSQYMLFPLKIPSNIIPSTPTPNIFSEWSIPAAPYKSLNTLELSFLIALMLFPRCISVVNSQFSCF